MQHGRALQAQQQQQSPAYSLCRVLLVTSLSTFSWTSPPKLSPFSSHFLVFIGCRMLPWLCWRGENHQFKATHVSYSVLSRIGVPLSPGAMGLELSKSLASLGPLLGCRCSCLKLTVLQEVKEVMRSCSQGWWIILYSNINPSSLPFLRSVSFLFWWGRSASCSFRIFRTVKF